MKLVEQSAQQHIIQNKAIPDQFNNAAIKEVTSQILSQLKGQVSQGNMQQVIAMFQSGTGRAVGSNPLVNNMITSVVDSLTSKFGISPDTARSVAGNMIPGVMNELIRKTNDPRDIDFDLQQMMRGMTGNSTLDISGMLSQTPKGAIGNIGNIFGKIFKK